MDHCYHSGMKNEHIHCPFHTPFGALVLESMITVLLTYQCSNLRLGILTNITITIMHGQHAGNLKCHDSSNATNRFISKKPCTGPLNPTGMQLLYCACIPLHRHNQLVYYILGKQVLVTEYFTFPTSIQQHAIYP